MKKWITAAISPYIIKEILILFVTNPERKILILQILNNTNMIQGKIRLLSIVLLLGVSNTVVLAQKKKEAPAKAPLGWHHLDLQKDGYPGISTEQAYEV